MRKLEGLSLIFKALGSEENLKIIIKLDKPKTIKQINRKLTKMPINRRINILENVGLIKRQRGTAKKKGTIELTKLGHKLRNLMIFVEKQY